MQVSDLMTRDVTVVSPDEPIRQAATLMANIDAGVLPVGEKDHLVGMITDRDIAIRGTGQGKGPDAKIRDVMSSEVMYCFEDQEIDDVIRNMGDIQVRRLPVLNREKRLIGILALGDVATAESALGQISQRGGQHSQSG